MPSLTIDWAKSPRIILVDAPDAEITQQELLNLLRDLESSLAALDDDALIEGTGKQELGTSGVSVAITNTLLNALLGFEPDTTHETQGTATANSAGLTLEDSGADFVADGVEPGALIINFDDYSVASVIAVVDGTHIIHTQLSDGTLNQWTIGDNYKIWNIKQCIISGGNLVAVDDVGAAVASPVYPTPFTQIILASSSSATLLNNPAAAVLADAVWDEPVSDHNIPGSYGEEVATKADLVASASTDYVAPSSGTTVYGTPTGDYTDVAVRDGVYWQIQEDAADGITVEMVFYLPSASHRPGSVSVFGRYIGQPAASHHQELWAWNYEASIWEELTDVFLPGGQTSDDLYVHEYYERHVDRNNSNEVKIRLVHHVTTYNPTHVEYLDQVLVSSIKVVTAADISDAVWDEIMSGHKTAGTAGLLVQQTAGLSGLYKRIHSIARDGNGNLLSATMDIYDNETDYDAETNPIATHAVSATFVNELLATFGMKPQ